MSLPEAVDAVQITEIAAEVFAGMVDREAGLLTSWQDGEVAMADPVYAWVDLSTEPVTRLLLTADADTANNLAQALLQMDGAGPVTETDMADAFGELVNILGGNIKALLPEYESLTLPSVSRQSPSGAGLPPHPEVVLAWRGRPLVISVWTIS